MNAVILVPVKEHARAKSRMSPLLTERERTALAWAMLEDLIAALAPLPWPVVLATSSSRAAQRARSLGWMVFPEEDQVSESASVDACSRRLAGEGVQAVLRLPADLPLIRSSDVAELMSLSTAPPAAILVPSRDLAGTNALLRTPPALFPSQFGPGSFALHLRAAVAAGADVRIVENARLALDLDDPCDLARFLARNEDCRTRRMLDDVNIIERLAAYVPQRDQD